MQSADAKTLNTMASKCNQVEPLQYQGNIKVTVTGVNPTDCIHLDIQTFGSWLSAIVTDNAEGLKTLFYSATR